jgi:hypothetical protein
MSTVKSKSKSKKTKRDFFERDEEQREAILAEMWCHRCMDVAEGIEEPQEFEGNGMIFLEGKCLACQTTVVMEIPEVYLS